MAGLWDKERGHAEWRSLHHRGQAASSSTVGGQGTFLKEFYYILCQVSLEHRSGTFFFFFF